MKAILFYVSAALSLFLMSSCGGNSGSDAVLSGDGRVENDTTLIIVEESPIAGDAPVDADDARRHARAGDERQIQHSVEKASRSLAE